MIKVEVMIEDAGGQAKVALKPMIPTGTRPTPLEVAAWEEMRARIFAKVSKRRRRR